mgnify:CR=1 FL=1
MTPNRRLRQRHAHQHQRHGAERIAQQPPHALRLAKNLLKHGQTTSYDTLMDMSAAAQAISHLTEDHMEGVDALLEKRPAVFQGR